MAIRSSAGLSVVLKESLTDVRLAMGTVHLALKQEGVSAGWCSPKRRIQGPSPMLTTLIPQLHDTRPAVHRGGHTQFFAFSTAGKRRLTTGSSLS